jgi:hypothetical protein
METQEIILTAQDRCDKCQSQAKVVADFLNGRLMFCWHHARRYREALELQAVVICEVEPDPLSSAV